MNLTRALSIQSQWRRQFVPVWGLAILLALPGSEVAFARDQKPFSDPAQQADAFPARIVATAPDLQLTAERARQADALSSFILGNLAEDDAEDDTALEQFRHTLALDPKQTDLALKVATELTRRGNISDAINVLKDNQKAVGKENATVQLFLAELYSKYLKKDALAVKFAEKALELEPNNQDACLALYQLYAQTGRDQKATQLLDKAAQLKDTTAKFWIQLGQVQSRLTMKDDGTTTPDHLARLNETYQKALALAPKDPAIVARVADFYVVSKQIKDAIPLYEQVVAMHSDSDDVSVVNVKDKLARCYRDNGQLDKAVALLQQVVADNPDRYDAYETLGELYEQKGDEATALLTYEQSLKVEPNQPLAYLRLAGLDLKNHHTDEAVKILTDAHARFPDLPRVTYFLAMALSQAKQNAMAVSMFDDAEQAAQDTQQDLLDAEFYYSYGAAAEQAGQIDKAVKMLKKSIAMDPANSAEACNYLGFMWVDRNQKLDEGGALIKRALQIEPDNPAYLDSLGWYYYRKGQYPDALPQLLKAVDRLQPEDPEVDEHVGDTYDKLGDTQKALTYWQRATALDPDNKDLAAKVASAKQKAVASPTVSPTAAPSGGNSAQN
ncbi:MAG: tetratricopeptide repeat protein [Chthoniobacteraceae bacterium]